MSSMTVSCMWWLAKGINGGFTSDGDAMFYGLRAVGGLMYFSLLLGMGVRAVFCKCRRKIRGAVERFVRDFL